LTPDMLPDKISSRTVEAAIDLDNDGKPDLLQTVFCCSKPNETWNKDIDCYVCEKTFKKINRVWKLMDFVAPC